jgi:thiazole synthase ThiGH ThiG subunit
VAITIDIRRRMAGSADRTGRPFPVISSGGVGKFEHAAEALEKGRADAALAASILHYGECSIGQAKESLAKRGIGARARGSSQRTQRLAGPTNDNTARIEGRPAACNGS